MAESKITVTTLEMFQEYHWLMLKVFFDATVERFGDDALEIIRRGAYDCGVYRGQRMHDQASSFLRDRTAVSLIEGWDTGEWELAAIDGSLTVTRTPTELILELPEAPGTSFFAQHGSSTTALEVYWPALIAGIVEGFGAGLSAQVSPATDSPWNLRLSASSEARDDEKPVLGLGESQPQALLEMSRRTSGLIAAFQMYVSRELVRRFDAAGEEVVQTASYQFGALRGGAIRAKHLSEGTEITLANFASKSGLQERDPSEAVFVFSEDQYVSDGAYYLDCTYCPLQEVWAHEGAEGLRLGYLFDAANHRGLFQSYHPETIVRWDSVKSRGDGVCKFRFTVPSLLTEDDPTPEQFASLRTAPGLLPLSEKER